MYFDVIFIAYDNYYSQKRTCCKILHECTNCVVNCVWSSTVCECVEFLCSPGLFHVRGFANCVDNCVNNVSVSSVFALSACSTDGACQTLLVTVFAPVLCVSVLACLRCAGLFHIRGFADCVDNCVNNMSVLACLHSAGLFHIQGLDPILSILLFASALALHSRQLDLKLRLDYLWAAQVSIGQSHALSHAGFPLKCIADFQKIGKRKCKLICVSIPW